MNKNIKVIGLVVLTSILFVNSACSSNNNNNENISQETKQISKESEKEKPEIKPEVKLDEVYSGLKVKTPNKNYPYHKPLGYLKKNKEVALTFDDGPSKYTPEVLKILKKYDVKATFCMIGVNIKNYPDIARKVVEDGHQICNHSYNHRRGVNRSSSVIISEDLSKTNKIFAKFLDGIEPVYYRAPEGIFYGSVPKALKKERMIPLGWSVDSEDWRKPGASKIVKNVVSTTNGGNIILMHDGGGDRTQTIKALPKIIESLKDNGYKFLVMK